MENRKTRKVWEIKRKETYGKKEEREVWKTKREVCGIKRGDRKR